MPLSIRSLVLVASLLSVPVARAADIAVPADHATIQAAINAASNGDVICVDPGTYVENLDLLGKAITLRSTGGPDVTTLSPPFLTDVIVQCISGEQRDTVIEGFTVTGRRGFCCQGSSPTIRDNIIEQCFRGGVYIEGGAPLVEDNTIRDNLTSGNGGGLYAEQSDVEVRGNWFQENRADFGGGLAVVFGAPQIEGNVFFLNEAAPSGPSRGGGLYLADCEAAVVNNVIRGNDAGTSGSGLYTLRCTVDVTDNLFASNLSRSGLYGLSSTLVVQGNTFQNHASQGLALSNCEATILCNVFQNGAGGASTSGGEVTIEGNTFLNNSRYGGLECSGGLLWVRRNRFEGNRSELYGGGAELSSGQLREVVGNLFLDNSAGTSGGGLSFLGEGTTFRDNTFLGNHAVGFGGGMSAFGNFTINGCTFHDNDADTSGPALWLRAPGVLSLVNSIVWDDVDRSLIDMWEGTLLAANCTFRMGTGTVLLNPISSLIQGPGLIDLDPQFVDPASDDLTLQAGSPCIDAATSSGTSILVDGAGRSRYVDGDLGGGGQNDMGAHEYHPCTLTLSGTPAVGQLITFETTGTAGLAGYFWIGLPGPPFRLAPFGVMSVNLGLPQALLAVGLTPNQVSGVVPTPAQGLDLVVQALVFDTGTSGGALTDPVFFSVE